MQEVLAVLILDTCDVRGIVLQNPRDFTKLPSLHQAEELVIRSFKAQGLAHGTPDKLAAAYIQNCIVKGSKIFQHSQQVHIFEDELVCAEVVCAHFHWNGLFDL